MSSFLGSDDAEANPWEGGNTKEKCDSTRTDSTLAMDGQTTKSRVQNKKPFSTQPVTFQNGTRKVLREGGGDPKRIVIDGHPSYGAAVRPAPPLPRALDIMHGYCETNTSPQASATLNAGVKVPLTLGKRYFTRVAI